MHAYLIMAHDDFYILEKLLRLLDDKRNDIYLHIDKKVKNFDFDYYKKMLKKSNLYYVKRLDVRWSDYSQIKCELNLLEAAIKKKYDYYHLLSGVDLPLKNQDYIHNFFKNEDKEFVVFRDINGLDEVRKERIKYYHLFFKNARSNNNFKMKLSQKLHYRTLNFQKKLKIDRVGNYDKFRDGANWFSITHQLAKYVVDNKKTIRKTYKFSYCADEIFLQTLVYNSAFYDKVYSKKNDDYNAIKRAIDWTRGAPYTYRISDFSNLMDSGMFFARKFSTNIDKEIVDRIFKYVKDDSNDKS